MKSWPAGEVVVGVADALVEVGLAVAVEVVQPGDLVAAEDVDLALGDDQPERLVQARGEPPPADVLERVVEARRRARRRPASCRARPSRRGGSRGRRRRAGPSRGSRTAARSCRSHKGRPCRACPWSSRTCGHCAGPPCGQVARADARSAGATIRVNWPSSTQGASSISTSPIAVGEDDPLAVAVEAVIDERLVRLLALGAGQGRAVDDQAVHEAVADVART